MAGAPRFFAGAPLVAADALSEILRGIRLSGAVFFRSRATAPWGVAGPPFDVFLEQVLPWAAGCRLALFHTVVEGECVCLLPGRLTPCSALLNPHSRALQRLCSTGLYPECWPGLVQARVGLLIFQHSGYNPFRYTASILSRML